VSTGTPSGAKRGVSKRRGLRGTVYSRGRKWAYMLDLGPDPLTGKRRQQAKTGFTSEQQAWDALAEAQAQVRTGSYIPSSRRSVREFFGEWLTAIESTVKPTTFANYSVYASAYVIPTIGDRSLQDIEPATITGEPPRFRTPDPIRSGPERRMINAGAAQEVHARVQGRGRENGARRVSGDRRGGSGDPHQ
jgi:Phage integrase, N-terminal SAM-like domain/Arm DNA-binding domain